MKSPSLVPERIAIIGNYATGKSDAWVAWAAQQRAGGSGHTYVVNAERDGSVQRSCERFDDWTENVTFQDVNDWMALRDATNLYTAVATADDLIVVDGADKPWTWVRELYDYTEAKKAGKLPDPDDPFGVVPEVDDRGKWDPIDTAYYKWFNGLIAGAQEAHVMFVGPSQPLKAPVDKPGGGTTWGDSKETLDLLSPYGVRWAGQKRLGFDVQTLLLAKVKAKAGGSTYTLTTMKDAGGREYLADTPVPVDGFPLTYLASVAGWEL